MKGRISKALIKNEYITLYEFKLIKSGVELKSIRKRFREIDILHHVYLRLSRISKDG